MHLVNVINENCLVWFFFSLHKHNDFKVGNLQSINRQLTVNLAYLIRINNNKLQ